MPPSVFRKPGFLNRVGEPMSSQSLQISVKGENRGVHFLIGVISIAVCVKWWFTGTVFSAFEQGYLSQAFSKEHGFSSDGLGRGEFFFLVICRSSRT